MPTYEYRCNACGHQFEEFQSITAKPLRKCPECEKPRLQRLIGTGAGIIFKGAGFYETDYRSESYKQARKAESDAAKPGSDGDKSSSTPAAENKPKPADTTKSAKKSTDTKK